ncbi:thrombopoietin isoform X2 [Thalassophryne amazonica]|uniref:thrombopoietin isoform X2 n=1 Tax=Thalassophryne amazonica TaxID=390379 RepID=UPI00147189A1|nr:thrombopoietin isoform X2 [Thalassophryne amazonica]
MALNKLLLLWMVASELRDAETKPIDFVCNRTARRAMNAAAAEMANTLSNCNALVTLATPVQLPCVALHKASWENTSHKQKRDDIADSLRHLSNGIKVARVQTQPGCVSSLLQRLERSASNYVHILTNLDLSGPVESPASTCVPQSSSSLSTVLRAYTRLISGKLEALMEKLVDKCPPQ